MGTWRKSIYSHTKKILQTIWYSNYSVSLCAQNIIPDRKKWKQWKRLLNGRKHLHCPPPAGAQTQPPTPQILKFTKMKFTGQGELLGLNLSSQQWEAAWRRRGSATAHTLFEPTAALWMWAVSLPIMTLIQMLPITPLWFQVFSHTNQVVYTPYRIRCNVILWLCSEADNSYTYQGNIKETTWYCLKSGDVRATLLLIL